MFSSIRDLRSDDMDELLKPTRPNHCPKCKVELRHKGWLNGTEILVCPECQYTAPKLKEV